MAAAELTHFVTSVATLKRIENYFFLIWTQSDYLYQISNSCPPNACSIPGNGILQWPS